MLGNKTYFFNKETCSFEVETVGKRKKILTRVGISLFVMVLLCCYYFLFSNVLHLKTPKMAVLLDRNEELLSKVEYLNQRMDKDNDALLKLQMRDNVVYRPIFGMEEISQGVRDAGFGGTDRYSDLDQLYNAGFLKSSVMRLDILTKKAYVQSRSFDDIQVLSKRAGDMASCIPNIFPVSTSAFNRISSSFGYRSDPFTHAIRMHTGVDISGPKNEPIYVTGDGKVVEVGFNFFGYGNFVVVDHGFGYKTLYGHLSTPEVAEGQMLHRGDEIGEMGNTGRSTGTHLHYEVRYKDRPINPTNFFDRDVSPKDYAKLVRSGTR
ncbi:MAG: M23 family metallopeptidase [Bacteroidales bacterium]|jgi:hypothetical protein|nr:M23 family metallopeptidase [Bacteroidales bacterium]MCI2122513.1 M23 family metallopeptidase [Bacteroidales bacterium]MCI2146249.1 M23 family metallopeptidase [Bacteroidales bacterium]